MKISNLNEKIKRGRPRKYREPMANLIIRIKVSQKNILLRNINEDRSMTSMVQKAIEKYIVWEELK